MSVENPIDSAEGTKSSNGTNIDHVNGVQNGYSSPEKDKSSHKSSNDNYHNKDKDHRNSSSTKHSSSSGRDKDRHSSSKDHRSSHKSSSRDKEKSDKDRERNDKDKDRKDKERSDKDRERSDKDKGKSDKSRERGDKDRERSDKDKQSSNKDRERNDKDRERSDKDKERGDRDKERSDRDKERSDRDKDKSDKYKNRNEKDKVKTDRGEDDCEKQKDTEKRDRSHHDKHKSSKDKKYSSSKDNKSLSTSKDHKSSRSSKEKHKSDKDKHRHSSSSSKHHSSSSGPKDKCDGKDKSDLDKSTSELENKTSEKKMEDVKSAEESTLEVDEIVKKEHDSWDANIPNGDKLNFTASSCDYSISQFKDEPIDNVKMEMDESEEDVPLSARVGKKRKADPMSESEEEKPLSARKQNKLKKVKVKKESDYDDEYSDEDQPKVKKKKKKQKPSSAPVANETTTPLKRKKKQEENEEVWKWWEEEKKEDGTKWKFLEHKGPQFAPPYERLPKDVIFRYDNKVLQLSEETEEVAGFYAKMLEHDYTSKPVFNDNFFKDWRKVMTQKEQSIIKDLSKCDFKSMHTFFTAQSEKNKNRSKEEKAALKAKNEEILKEYGFCTIDGHKEKIGNFKIEPPGLFRGRGEHPKMGMLKKRVLPEHVSINCSKDSKVPNPPDGHKWKEVRHDNSVTWLASWTENVQGQVKYVMLNPGSKLKGEKDWQKYETARKLHVLIDKIRENYRNDWKAKEMRVRQRAVAMYFIDKLALRAGNEKDEDQADTVGCCSLRVEHIELHKELNGKEYVVVFDFLGKDSIRYYNEVEVEKRVFKNLELFKENKKGSDDLFDRLNTQILNEHLRDLMNGLTAKVFRTYNASITLQRQLNELTDPDYSLAEKILAYNRANRAVAILCNHQRAVPKGHQKSMQALKDKITLKHEQIEETEADLKQQMKLAKKGSVKEKLLADKKKKNLERLMEQLKKLEVQETDRDENKTIALGTSKLNYLDPRISVAWCKKYDVPLEKIYNKTQRDKFRWAIDMADADYIF